MNSTNQSIVGNERERGKRGAERVKVVASAATDDNRQRRTTTNQIKKIKQRLLKASKEIIIIKLKFEISNRKSNIIELN